MSISDGVFAVAVAMGVSGLMVDGVVKIAATQDTSAFFEVREIRAERVGNTANLWVDRSIYAPIHMEFTVRVMQEMPDGWREACSMHGAPRLYMPDVVIDQPVTLDWWTLGQCKALPEGRARIITTWSPTARKLQPVTYTVEIEG